MSTSEKQSTRVCVVDEAAVQETENDCITSGQQCFDRGVEATQRDDWRQALVLARRGLHRAALM